MSSPVLVMIEFPGCICGTLEIPGIKQENTELFYAK